MSLSAEAFVDAAVELVVDAARCDETTARRLVAALELGGFLAVPRPRPGLPAVCPPSAMCPVCAHRRGECTEGSCQQCDDARDARWAAMTEEA